MEAVDLCSLVPTRSTHHQLRPLSTLVRNCSWTQVHHLLRQERTGRHQASSPFMCSTVQSTPVVCLQLHASHHATSKTPTHPWDESLRQSDCAPKPERLSRRQHNQIQQRHCLHLKKSPGAVRETEDAVRRCPSRPSSSKAWMIRAVFVRNDSSTANVCTDFRVATCSTQPAGNQNYVLSGPHCKHRGKAAPIVMVQEPSLQFGVTSTRTESRRKQMDVRFRTC